MKGTAENKMEVAVQRIARGLIFVVSAVIAFLFILAVLIGGAISHEWYPTECCSGHDCAPAARERIEQTPQGYIVDGRHFVSNGEVKRSMDGRYHVCFPTQHILRCLFVPPEGS